MKITVITVTYNCASLLQMTIDSIINQSYRDIEYIVVDGASTDGTVDIIKANETHITKWISEPDKGIYYAMNKGIDMTTGDYIIFMNAGDSFYDLSVIENVFKRASANSDFIYGDTNYFTSLGSYIKDRTFYKLSDFMPFCHQSVFVKTSLMKKYKFDVKYRIAADRNLFYKLTMELDLKSEYIPIVVSNFECESGLSSTLTIRSSCEKAMVDGSYHKIGWKIWFVFYYFNIKVRQFIKIILPQTVVNRIKMKNMYELRNRS